MKVVGVISTMAVFLLLGAIVPAFAQEEHHEEGAKPTQREEQAKPAEKQEQAKPAGLRIGWFDPIAEVSELPDHSRRALLL